MAAKTTAEITDNLQDTGCDEEQPVANPVLTYDMVPTGFQLCVNSDCPKAESCLRYQSSTLCTNRDVFFTVLNPAYAQAHADHCKYFHPIRAISYAKGFTRMLRKLPKEISDDIRNHLIGYFGHTQYYRARKGEVLIAPKEQRYIRNLIKKYRQTLDEPFDGYELRYKFDDLTTFQAFD